MLSIDSLFTLSLTLGVFAIVAFLAGMVLVVIANHGRPASQIKFKTAGPVTRFGFACVALCVVSMLIAIMAVITAAGWWFVKNMMAELTPGRLALYALLIGPSPLILAVLGVLSAKILGCRVDASGAYECRLLGMKLDGLIYNLFMMYWMTIFTGGLAMICLMVSGVWALIRTF